MAVIVDTSVWVEADRVAGPVRAELDRLLAADQVALVGVIFAELARGTRSENGLATLQRRLEPLRYLDSDFAVWLRTGRILADLARNGNSVPLADALIAAHALVGEHSVFTRDKHFERVPSLKLHQVSGKGT